MYIYRVLNNYDVFINPEKNGLYGKKIINDSLEEISRRWALIMNNKMKSNMISSKELLKDKKDELIKDATFLTEVKLHLDDTWKYFYNKALDYKYGLIKLNEEDQIKIGKYFHDKIYNSVKQHLSYGNTINTNWISFTNDIEKIIKYYKNQDYNQIAIIDSDIKDNIIDNGILALNMSNLDSIENIKPFLFVELENNLIKNISNNYRGFNYSVYDKEILYYNHIPSDRIITILDQFSFDLLYNDIYDGKILYSKDNKIFTYFIKNELLTNLKELKKDKLIEIYDLLYVKNNSISSLINKGYSYNELINIKREILSHLNINQNLGVKPYNKQKIKIPESKMF